MPGVLTLLRGSLTICDLLLEMILQGGKNNMVIQQLYFQKYNYPLLTHRENKHMYCSPLQQGMGQGVQLVHLFLDF